MSYFKYLPYTFLQVSKTENILVKDIIRAIRLEGFDNDALYYPPYLIADNESPELISLKFYDTVANGWIIQLVNNKFDYINDFPVSDNVLLDYCKKKYSNPNAVHHHVDINGNIVDAFSGGFPVTNYEFEVEENEKKRQCMILRPEFVSLFRKKYQELMSNV